MRFLLLALGLLSQATPALADPNWLYLGGSGAGVNRTGLSIDLNSSRLLPNGVTSYAYRIEGINPINLEKMKINLSGGIDCKSMEAVNMATGKRTQLSKEQVSDLENKSPAAVAARNFCPLPDPQPQQKQQATKK
jgi:hypothetical protein